MSERTASPLRLRRPGWVDEFRAFIMRGNVVDLAIGIIIGSAFTAIVNSLVRDIFTPVIGFLSSGSRFNNIFVTLAGPRAATLADAEKAGAVTLNIGDAVNGASRQLRRFKSGARNHRQLTRMMVARLSRFSAASANAGSSRALTATTGRLNGAG